MAGSFAPGRLDLMGGVADYSGSHVLQASIRLGTTATATTDGPADRVTLSSDGFGEVSAPIAVFAAEDGAVKPLPDLAAALRSDSQPGWAMYALGSVAAWAVDQGLPASRLGGLKLSVTSTVPAGMGVSSSASVEVAVLRAVSALLPPPATGWDPSSRDASLRLARLAWLAETRVAGVPCGTMDQLAVACGSEGCLLPIRCRPSDPLEPVPLPGGVAVVGWPSGIKHDLGTSPYRFARTACFMAKRLAEDAMERSGRRPPGLSAPSSGPLRLDWLAGLPLHFVQAFLAPGFPATMTGEAFLAAHGPLEDEGSRVEPGETYPVLAALRFAAGEDDRVRAVTSLLRLAEAAGAAGGAGASAATEDALRSAGALMSEAHGDYTALGLGSEGTDAIVAALTQELGPDRGVYGARVSGGGSGGTVAVLCREDALPAIAELASEARFDFVGSGRPPTLIR